MTREMVFGFALLIAFAPFHAQASNSSTSGGEYIDVGWIEDLVRRNVAEAHLGQE